MTDRVQCAECGTSYDSEEDAFCPRCGGMKQGTPTEPALELAARSDPRRRRVQVAGVLLVALGLMAVAMFGTAIAMAPSLVPETMTAVADQPGGDLHVRVLDDGAPAPDLPVTVAALNGTVLANGTTDGQGWVNFTALAHAGVTVNVAAPSGPMARNVVTLGQANEGPSARVVTLDVAHDAPTSDTWVGAGAFVTAAQVIAAVFVLIAVVTLVGGVAAMRLRRRALAMAGALTGALPWLVIGVASLNAMVFLLLLVFGVAVWILRQGRDQFTD